MKHPKCYIFLETSGKIQLNEGDPNHHDHPSGTSGGWMTSSMYGEVPDKKFSLNIQSYIFLETSGLIQFNEDDPNHHDHHQEPLKWAQRAPPNKKRGPKGPISGQRPQALRRS